MEYESIHNAYDLFERDDLSEYRSQGTYFKHKKSGCEVYHVANEDQENLFCFAFRTPPENSNGVAHIMEHTVLCGSEKFDIKDPFITLYRGSMNTYLNAGTGSDDTIFPAASVVEKDFFNLMMIYGDAVFFPLLRKEAFEQEGHHLEFDEEGRLQRVGIVYNEMKGDYSSFDSVVSESSYCSLYTEGPLQFDAGGDPAHIPDLTYEQFKAFHETYYHPSNCRIFLYGNIPMEKILDFLDRNFLSRFDKREISVSFPLQKRWSEPRRFSLPAPASEEEDGVTHSINWLLEPVEQVKELTALRVLSSILLGNSGAPLQMAIEQSDLGDDLSPVSGLDMALYETLFSVGIRGAEKEGAADFEKLIFSTLEKIVKEGLPEEIIEGTFRRQEFREREIRGGIPFGYRLMHKSIRGWLHGMGPSDTLYFDKWISLIREEAREKGYFEKLISKYLLNNTHRSHVTVYPDGELVSRKEQEVRQSLDELQGKMTAEEKAALDESNRKLRLFQEKEDDPSVVPCLHRDDIPRKIITIPSSKSGEGDRTFYKHEFFTNGILYLDMLFPLEDLSEEEILWLPFFSQIFFEVGMPGLGYDEAAREIALKLGGLTASLEAGVSLDTNKLTAHLVIRTKMLQSQTDEGMELAERLIRGVDFSDTRRMGELLTELKNDYRSSFVPSGSSYAVSHTVRGYTPSTALEELWYGIDQYFHLTGCGTDRDSMEQLGGLFRGMKDKILRGRANVVNVTSDPGEGEPLRKRAVELLDRLPAGKGNPFVVPPFGSGPRIEAFKIPADVSYMGASLKGALLGTREYSAQLILTHLLKSGYLWEEVRMKGGAYGASASLSGLDGYFTFSSYRDPQIGKTIETFRKGLIEYPARLTKEDLERALIGVIGKDLKPLAPLEKGILALRRDMYGISDEIRQEKRDTLLSLGIEDIRSAAAGLAEQWDDLTLTVISGDSLLDGASEKWPGLKEFRKSLL
ncbi:MAG: insulinase family protein [Spirochaetales bacterium]|nr:insulinase family protein [Spirochaetales bacterium]